MVSLASGLFPVNFSQNGSCDMSMCILTAQARPNLAAHFSGASFFLFVFVSNGPRDMSMCRSTAHTEFLQQRPLIGSLYRDLAKRPLMGYGDLVQRSCQEEVSYRHLANRVRIEILCRDLARRPPLEILYRDLVKRAEVLLGDHL